MESLEVGLKAPPCFKAFCDQCVWRVCCANATKVDKTDINRKIMEQTAKKRYKELKEE